MEEATFKRKGGNGSEVRGEWSRGNRGAARPRIGAPGAPDFSSKAPALASRWCWGDAIAIFIRFTVNLRRSLSDKFTEYCVQGEMRGKRREVAARGPQQPAHKGEGASRLARRVLGLGEAFPLPWRVCHQVDVRNILSKYDVVRGSSEETTPPSNSPR